MVYWPSWAEIAYYVDNFMLYASAIYFMILLGATPSIAKLGLEWLGCRICMHVCITSV